MERRTATQRAKESQDGSTGMVGYRTPKRSFRVPDEVYEAAKAFADAEGVTISQVVRDALIDYVERRTKAIKEGSRS